MGKKEHSQCLTSTPYARPAAPSSWSLNFFFLGSTQMPLLPVSIVSPPHIASLSLAPESPPGDCPMPVSVFLILPNLPSPFQLISIQLGHFALSFLSDYSLLHPPKCSDFSLPYPNSTWYPLTPQLFKGEHHQGTL